MAYVYPEDKIVNGQVIDPAAFNRTLGRYIGEMSGMLDRDNFYRGVVTSIKLNTISSTSGASSYQWTGPCNHVKSWWTSTAQYITVGSSTKYISVTGIGGTFETKDSGLEIEFSCYVGWGDTTFLYNRCEFMVVVDNIEVCSTGPIASMWREFPVYLTGYIPVGAGSHTITVFASVYAQDLTTLEITPSNQTFGVLTRELIVEEAVR